MTPDTAVKDAAELLALGRQIRAYQEAKGLTDALMIRKFTGLGSSKTYWCVLNHSIGELDLEKWVSNYRTVWALIDSIGADDVQAEEIYDDLTPALLLKRAVIEAMRSTGNDRLILLQGDTGTGKTCGRRVLIDRFGGRVLCVEANECWSDSPMAMLHTLLKALGETAPPTTANACLTLVVSRLSTHRLCIVIEEAHHMGRRILNTIKTLINQTMCEFVLLAMPQLWIKLKHQAFQEVRQLTGNRLSEHILIEGISSGDVTKFVLRRVPGTVKSDIAPVVKALVERAPEWGNLAYVREVCRRVTLLADGEAPANEIWSAAMTEEIKSRKGK